MYLLYLDDSGSVGNEKEDYFVLGGFCIPEKSVYWLTNKMDNLAQKINKSDPNKVEFHASEIYRGKVFPWSNYNKRKDRIKIIKDVLLLLKEAYDGIPTFAFAVHKKSYPQFDPVEMAFEDLSKRFDLFLNRIYHDSNLESHKGMIILDESTYENILQKMAIFFQQKGTKWGDLKDIIEVPLFVDSKASRLIQMADHIAYAVFRRYNADDLTYFNCIEKRFDNDQGVIHGLVHKQLNNLDCTCPACMSRKLSGEHP